MRVVVAEDLVLLRDGLTRLLQAHGIEVAAAIGDTASLPDILALSPTSSTPNRSTS